MWNYLKKIFTVFLIIVFLLQPSYVEAINLIFGVTINNADNADSNGDTSRVSAFVAQSSGTLKNGTVRVSLTSAGSIASKMVVYSDSGGNPTTLLATSDEVTITNTSEAEITYTFSGSQQISLTGGTTYWFGLHHAATGGGYQVRLSGQSTGTNTLRTNTDAYSGGAETTFVSDASNSFIMDAYLVFDDGTSAGASYPIINPNLYDSGLRIDFDGVDERLTSASNPSYSTDTKSGGRTLCMWFNLDSLPATETAKTLFSWSNSDAQGVWNFRIRTDRASHSWSGTRFELQTALDTGAGTGTSTFIYSSAQTFSATTNYHLCLVSSGTAWTLYVNGSSTTLTVGAAGSGGNDGDWWGDVNGSGTITFFIFGVTTDGKADDVSYYDDDLTSAEVLRLYNSGKPIHPLAVGLTDLSGYWKLGESDNGSVTTIYDSKGSDNYAGSNVEDADIVRTNYY